MSPGTCTTVLIFDPRQCINYSKQFFSLTYENKERHGEGKDRFYLDKNKRMREKRTWELDENHTKLKDKKRTKRMKCELGR